MMRSFGTIWPKSSRLSTKRMTLNIEITVITSESLFCLRPLKLKIFALTATAVFTQLLQKPKDYPIEIDCIHRHLGSKNTNPFFMWDTIPFSGSISIELRKKHASHQNAGHYTLQWDNCHFITQFIQTNSGDEKFSDSSHEGPSGQEDQIQVGLLLPLQSFSWGQICHLPQLGGTYLHFSACLKYLKSSYLTGPLNLPHLTFE